MWGQVFERFKGCPADILPANPTRKLLLEDVLKKIDRTSQPRLRRCVCVCVRYCLVFSVRALRAGGAGVTEACVSLCRRRLRCRF